jgi:hypothetical protein
VAGSVTGREQQLNRAVAEKIVIVVDEDQLALIVDVVTWKEEVSLDRLGVPAGFPFATLDDDGDARGQ